MATLTVTPDGSLRIPKEFVESIGIRPGEQVRLEAQSDRLAILKPSRFDALPRKTGRIEDIFGMLAGKTEVRLTIEEMNESIIQGCVEEYESGLRRC